MPTNKQRRDAQRRHLERQLERRREREIRRRKSTLILSIVGTLVLVAAVIVAVVLLGNSDKTKTPSANSQPPTTAATTPPASSSSAAPVAAYPCTWTTSGTAAKKVNPPSTTKPSKKGTVQVAVKTTQGDMTFTLNRAAAPCAVESFISLAAQKYFNGTPCHRLTTNTGLYVLQCGDPSGTGSGGPGYSFADELSGKEKYTRGVLAMANSGANTNGSQFFIVYKASQLPPSYTVFGTVTQGLSVVDKVAAKGSPNGDGKPKLPISLTTVTPAATK